MAYNRVQARSICNATELDHFNHSLGDAVGALSEVQLRSRITKVRTLRDKYSDLFRRQSLSTRAATGSKGGPTGAANARTAQKAQLLAETLARFEAQLAKAQRRPSSPKAKSPTKAAAARPPAEPAPPKDSARKRALAPRTAKAAAAPATLPETKAAAGASRKPPPRKPAPPKAPVPTKGNPISPVVRVRGKEIAAHVRSAGRRVQAKRDSR